MQFHDKISFVERIDRRMTARIYAEKMMRKAILMVAAYAPFRKLNAVSMININCRWISLQKYPGDVLKNKCLVERLDF